MTKLFDLCQSVSDCGLDDWPDVFRLINAGLSLFIAGSLMFDHYAPWRNKESMLKFQTFALAGCFIWQAYTAIEVIWFVPNNRTPEGVVSDAGIRVYGFTFWFTMVVIALVIRRHRAKTLQRAVY